MTETAETMPTPRAELLGYAVSGYKAYAREARVDLGRITVLLGRNNAGKSALAFAPIFLCQALKPDAKSPFDLLGAGIDFGRNLLDVCYRRQLTGLRGRLFLGGASGVEEVVVGATAVPEQAYRQVVTELAIRRRGEPLDATRRLEWEEARRRLSVFPALATLAQSIAILLAERPRIDRSIRLSGAAEPMIGPRGEGAFELLAQSKAGTRPDLIPAVNHWRASFAADIEDRDMEPGSVPARPFAWLATSAPAADDRPAHCMFVLRPEDAGEWAEQPLRLLLENERDWLLLECMAQAFGASAVEDAYLHGWLRPDGRGGGGEVLVAVRARRRLERLFVFVDSDRTAHDKPPAETTSAIVDECATEPRVPCHITQRREKENYIPLQLLSDLAHSGKKRRGRAFRQKLQEWLALDEQERHHDDVRSRFGDALTDEALTAMRRCRPEWLRDAGGAEMRDTLVLIEEHL